MTRFSQFSDYPRLRPLDIRHHVQGGQPYILLRDLLQLSEGMLLIPQPLAAALAFVDGRHDAAGIARAFTQHYRMILETETVEELLAALDQALLLENERSAQAIQQLLDEYRQAPFRQPTLAGRGYPAEPAALHQFLNDYLEAADVEPRPLGEWPQRMGLLSPHIDYARGGPVYAQVWKHVGEAVKAADLVIMLGTDHYGDDPITLTRQNYATPYGVLPTDQAIVDKLAEAVGAEAAFAGELRHRDEHSLELVAVWLHHMRDGEPVPVVPILTGSFYRFMVNGGGPAGDPMLERLLETLREASAGRRVVVVASGDLAHVGPEFGGAPLDEAARKRVRQADDELIEHMQAGDSDGFYQAIQRVENGNNVCGVSPIYLTMRLVESDDQPLTGQPFGYATCPADATDTSSVTVCGMAFS